jgi:hypothetical protein
LPWQVERQPGSIGVAAEVGVFVTAHELPPFGSGDMPGDDAMILEVGLDCGFLKEPLAADLDVFGKVLAWRVADGLDLGADQQRKVGLGDQPEFVEQYPAAQVDNVTILTDNNAIVVG